MPNIKPIPYLEQAKQYLSKLGQKTQNTKNTRHSVCYWSATHGLHIYSTWTPHILHMYPNVDSILPQMWSSTCLCGAPLNPQNSGSDSRKTPPNSKCPPCGLHVEVWLSVKRSRSLPYLHTYTYVHWSSALVNWVLHCKSVSPTTLTFTYIFHVSSGLDIQF